MEKVAPGGEMKYLYAWGNNTKRATLKGRRCAIVQRLKNNSAVVQFENGQTEIVSRNALRRAPR